MKVKSKKKKGPTPSCELQKAFDAFPKTVKLKEKAAREKKRIMKNFMSVKSSVYES